MDKHNHLSIMNLEQTICENLIEIDYGSFKEIYELNSANTITFTAFRTNSNRFVFDLLVNENFVIYKGQKYIIKNIVSKIEGNRVACDITAYHMMYEFQNHFVEQQDDENTERVKKEYSLEQYLNYGFKNQNTNIQYTYKIHGDFKEKALLDELGGKNGIEYIKDAIEPFGCIIYPSNNEIGFYTPEAFYQTSEEVIRYKYNTDTITATINTVELRTVVKAYGKKVSNDEKKKNQNSKKYEAMLEYVSPQAKTFGKRYATPIHNEDITDANELKNFAIKQLQDKPKTELDVNYISHTHLSPRYTVFFIHELMNYNTELKVVKLEKGHLFVKTIDVVSFSNDIKDMVKIQQALNKKLKAQDNRINYQFNNFKNSISMNMKQAIKVGEAVGSVLE